MVLDDHHDYHGVGDGRNQEQWDVHADQQYAPELGEPHLRRRELGDQFLDDRPIVRLAAYRPRAEIAGRRVVEHLGYRRVTAVTRTRTVRRHPRWSTALVNAATKSAKIRHCSLFYGWFKGQSFDKEMPRGLEFGHYHN